MIYTDIEKRKLVVRAELDRKYYDVQSNWEGQVLTQVNGRTRLRGGDGRYWTVTESSGRRQQKLMRMARRAKAKFQARFGKKGGA